MNRENKTREKRFILDCLRSLARNRPSAGRMLPMEETLKGLDWTFCLKAAERHRLLPFLFIALRGAQDCRFFASSVQPKLEGSYKRSLALVMRREREFRGLAALFERAGIPVAPLKGMSLLQRVYSSMPVRQMDDIDVLVREEDVGRAERTLWNSGYEPARELPTAWHDRVGANFNGRWLFTKGRQQIDLQWNPRFGRRGQHGFDMGAIWARMRSIRSFGRNVFMLAPEDEVLYLVCQILHDIEFERVLFFQFLDVALLIKDKKRAFPPEVPVADDVRVKNEFSPASIVRSVEACFYGNADNLISFLEPRRGQPPFFSSVELMRAVHGPVGKARLLAGFLFPDRGYLEKYSSGRKSSQSGFALYGRHLHRLARRIRARFSPSDHVS